MKKINKKQRIKLIEKSRLEYNKNITDRHIKVSFMNYLINHPEERLWQIIRNWSKVDEIRICKFDKKLKMMNCEDSFYI